MKLRLLSPSPNGSIPAAFELPQDKTSLSIGRTDKNQLFIDETSISAHHAKIEVSDEGEYELVDLDSSNGTFVNESKITRTTIHSGDIVRFANTRFFFEETDVEEASPISPTTAPVETSTPNQTSEELESIKNALWEKDTIAANLQKSLDAKKAEKFQLSSDLKMSRDSNETLKHSLSSAKATIESLKLTQTDLQNALELEKSRSAGLSADLSESQDSNQSLTQNLDDANANIESLQLTQNDLSNRQAELEKAILEALEDAKSIQISLNGDWLRWTGETDSKTSANAIAKASNAHTGIAAIAAILVDLKTAREKMRSELNKIEAIWDKCGPNVEGFLSNICSELKDEIASLSGVASLREKTIEELEADLLTLRQGIDEQLRRAQTISREGIRCEILEDMDKMVLATDTEETIFRKIVARIDTINELSSHYHKKLTSRKIAKSLDSLRDDFLDLLEEHSVTPFTFDQGAILTKRDSAEVDLISSGHRQNAPSHMDGPVKVIQTLYPGMILKAGDKEIIIKKARVEVKPA